MNPTRASSQGRYLAWTVVAVVVLLAGLVRLRLLETPLERDEGEYAYAGQLMLEGVPPYQNVYNMKFPGTYAAYAVMIATCGATAAGIHIGLLVVNAGSIVMIFLLGKRLFSASAGIAAAAAYALLSLGSGVMGTQAHATHFVVAAALGGSLMLLRALPTGRPVILFLSATLYGVAILMKQHGALFALFGALYLMWDHWSEHRGSWPEATRKAVLFAGGVTVPLVATGLVMWRAGTFQKFWFWTIVYAREYVSEQSLAAGWNNLMSALPGVVGPNLPLWIVAAAGFFRLWSRPGGRHSAVFVTGLLVVSSLVVCPGFYFRGHYFVLLLPAIALLAGAGFSALEAIFQNPVPPTLIYVVLLCLSVRSQRDFIFRLTPLEVSRRMYGLNPFPEAVAIAEYLRQHSTKDSRIAVLGSEPEIYFHAARRSATGYIYTYGMMEPQPYALAMQTEMIRELETSRPAYVVLVNIPWSWLVRPDSSERIFEWWREHSAQHYRTVALVDIFPPDRTEYRWDHVEFSQPRSDLNLIVYQRDDL